jgi:hypothetical protein
MGRIAKHASWRLAAGAAIWGAGMAHLLLGLGA